LAVIVFSFNFASIKTKTIKMRIIIFLLLAATHTLSAMARSRVFDPTVKTLQAMVGGNWMTPLVMELGGDNVMTIGFDQLSHDHRRYTYRIEHCEYDWTASTEIFESDYLEGFNNNPIDDYGKSINTNILYTHYSLEIPNDRCRLKMSGNYRLSIFDEEQGERVAEVEFRVVDPQVNLSMTMTTNTDIDINDKHQQVNITLDHSNLNVSNPKEQIRLVVKQNDCEESLRQGVAPNLIGNGRMTWEHNRQLIFEAGNEYHKYEILDVSHPTMGIDKIEWDGHDYQVYPFEDSSRKNYLTDVSANGYSLVRNSENTEVDYTCDYVYVHYCLVSPPLLGTLYVDGHWASDNNRHAYAMDYDHEMGCYRATILQKQGYYSYRYLLEQPDGSTALSPTEGNFYETENEYQAYIYYKGNSDRTWRIVGKANL